MHAGHLLPTSQSSALHPRPDSSALHPRPESSTPRRRTRPSREPTYIPDLTVRELLSEIACLVERQRHVDRLLCRYLADLADRVVEHRHAELFAYGDVFHAARTLFGLGTRATRERVRVGRALRELPKVEAALLDGSLGYSRVREISRVAKPEDEASWLDLARQLEMRTLEQRVAEAGGSRGDRRIDETANTRWASPKTVRVEVSMSVESWAFLQRAMEGARQGSESSLSDAEALEAVARDALATQFAAADPDEVRRNVVLYECDRCHLTEVETGAGAMPLEASAAAQLGCGARVTDLRTEGRVVRRGGPLPAAVRRAVLLRDRGRCRVPGCNRRRYVDVHHIKNQAKGGAHSRENCVTLCGQHHRMLHEGSLVVEGDADSEISCRYADGRLILDALDQAMTQLGSPGGESDTGEPAGDALPDVERRPSGVRDPGGDSPEDGDRAAEKRDARRLLSIMGAVGNWHPDALARESGLPIPRILCALTLLELSGEIRVEVDGLIRLAGDRRLAA